MKIDAQQMHFQTLNELVRESAESEIVIEHCNGQRYIGSGMSGKRIEIYGTPGNALGAYLNGADITVYGNAQDATGDTMNDGTIIIHGSSGDATGYAMRGGCILVQGNAGYRAGIHMKEYREKSPVVVIGGTAGCFLGEYQAGGTIIVLGIGSEGEVPVGDFCGTGMHGGRMFLRSDRAPHDLPPQVVARRATAEELAGIADYIEEYCRVFGASCRELMEHPFYLLTPDTKNPYKQLYTHN